jgi:hypothetical protein
MEYEMFDEELGSLIVHVIIWLDGNIDVKISISIAG